MRFVATLGLWGMIQAGVWAASTTCDHNNCLRAVIASDFPTRSGTADCASYFEVTVTPTTSSSTITATPTSIPSYASACSGSVAYSSACSCLGVTKSTKTSSTNPTCGPGTISCNGGPCQDALSDPNNCGACGNVCPSGICQNGVCSAQVCDGSACGSLNSCEDGCFCFENSEGTGFCGPDVACAPLADCTSSADCAQGEVCATSTCCSRNVCLGSCDGTISVRSPLLLGRNSTEMYTGGERSV